MKVQMLRARMYRGEALAPGIVTEMDDHTAHWFIAQGWSVRYADPAPLTTEKADALIPMRTKTRRAIR